MDIYEKKYKEALGWMQSLYSSLHGAILEDAEHYFPELKESEDERIRKALIRYFTLSDEHAYYEACGVSYRDIVAWLEKQGEQKLPIEKLPSETKTIGKSLGFTTQEDCDRYNQMVSDLIMSDDDKGEQKPADKAEPKFHEGDWIINNEHNNIVKVLEVNEQNKQYKLDYCGAIGTMSIELIDIEYHLWTIADAKDGDILVCDDNPEIIMLFKSLRNIHWAFTHFHIYNDGDYRVNDWCDCGENVHPASKEQCDLLYQKIKGAGYKWDPEKKELSKYMTMTSEKVSPAWSKEDDIYIENIILAVEKQYPTAAKDIVDWLKSLKNRINNF